MQSAQFAAIAACVILAALTVFQAALIAGAPIGRFAWGGRHDVLPAKLRIGSVTSIVLYILIGYVALAKAGMAPPLVSEGFTDVTCWVLTGYLRPWHRAERHLPQQAGAPGDDTHGCGPGGPLPLPVPAIASNACRASGPLRQPAGRSSQGPPPPSAKSRGIDGYVGWRAQPATLQEPFHDHPRRR